MTYNQPDRELIRGCQHGDKKSFEELIHKYQNKVYSLCYRFSGNHHDANDLAQETFLKLYNSISKFNGKSAFSTWLYRVTANVCLDEIRKKKRTTYVSLDVPKEQEDGELYFYLPDHKYDPELLLEKKDARRIIQEAIKHLPEDQRIMVVFREIEGLSYEELSQVLNISIGTVKSRLSRARNNLKEILTKRTEFFSENSHLKGKEV